MRIAYVEDNAMNLALVQRIALMGGHQITSFTEGEIALTELARQPFDLILMDIELAGEMNGLQVVRGLRARGLTTPIVAVTAYAMLGDQEKTLDAGCNEYLPKPLPIADFLGLLARYEAQLEAKRAAPVLVAALPVPEAAVAAPTSPNLAPPMSVPVETVKVAAPPSAPAAIAAKPPPLNGERHPESSPAGNSSSTIEPSPTIKSSVEPQKAPDSVVQDKAKATES